MLAKSVLVALLPALAAAIALPDDTFLAPRQNALVRACGTGEPTDEHKKISQQFSVLEAANNSTTSKAAATITVDAYFHIVAASTSVADGYATVSL